MRPVLIFSRGKQLLTVLDISVLGTTILGEFPAANNVTASSRGPWPEGVYKAERLIHLPPGDDDPNGPYGPRFMRFIVPDRDGIDDALDLYSDGLPDPTDGPGVGMGIHSGRRDGEDSQGRRGHLRVTLGCIRTTDEATELLASLELPDRLVVLG